MHTLFDFDLKSMSEPSSSDDSCFRFLLFLTIFTNFFQIR